MDTIFFTVTHRFDSQKHELNKKRENNMKRYLSNHLNDIPSNQHQNTLLCCNHQDCILDFTVDVYVFMCTMRVYRIYIYFLSRLNAFSLNKSDQTKF